MVALVVLDPSTGNLTRTLVSAGVSGDEISVSPDGSTVYCAQGGGCKPEIASVPTGGGSPARIVSGELPAMSPDGSELAFISEPPLTVGCVPAQADLTKSCKLVIRTLSSGAGRTLPMPPAEQRSYIREGIFLPDGNLLISRACCGGVPIHSTSRLMWEVAASGALMHQVAIGYPTLEHTSLAASSTGQWLLYLAGGDLYVCENGARPSTLATGLIAATWE